MKTLKLFIGLMFAAACSAQAETLTVEVRDNFFEPAELTIEPGDTVRWVNKGTNEHNVKADDNSFRCAKGCDAEGKSYHGGGGGGTSSPGDPSNDSWEFTRTFDQEGDVPYHCENHGSAGGFNMAGTITVKQSEPDGMPINFGHGGSWFNPDQAGQGFSLEVVPASQEGEPDQLVAYWFTFAPNDGATARLAKQGVEDQRWFQAQGTIDGSTAELDKVQQVTGGIFDDPENVSSIDVGLVTIQFASCTEAALTYSLDLDGDGSEETTGDIDLVRLTPDVLCEEMASGG